MEKLIANFNYVIVVILMMIGLWSMLAQKNLIKILLKSGINAV